MKKQEKSRFNPTVLFVLLIIFPFFLAVFSFAYSSGVFNSVSYKSTNTPIDSYVKFENAKKIVKQGQKLQVFYNDGTEKTYYVAKDFRLSESGIDTSKVEIYIKNESDSTKTGNINILSVVPILEIGLPIIFLLLMLYHALAIYKKDGLIWTVLILLIFPIGAIAYYFTVYRNIPRR